MRTVLRLLAVPALALAAVSQPRPALAQADARGILFAAAVREDGEASLEPIAVLGPDGRFDRPDSDPEPDPYATLRTRWMRPGARYDVLSRGERIGSTTVARSDIETDGCVVVAAYGPLEARTLPGEWRGLAGSGLPEQRGAPWLRAPTAAERRELDRMGTALFNAHGIDPAPYTQADTSVHALHYGPGARPALVGHYELMRGDTLARQASVFIVAEAGENGYRPTYAWFNEGTEGDAASRSLVDAADLDGDGEPELVVRTLYYENWTFTILRRFAGRWSDVYDGGGGGC